VVEGERRRGVSVPARPISRGRAVLLSFLLLLALLLLARWGVVLYVDFLWFASLGEGGVFWTRLLWEWGVRLGVGGLAALAAWINIRILLNSFRGLQIRRRYGDLVILEQLPLTYVRWAAFGMSALVGLWFSAAVPQGTGLRGLLLVHGEPWGTTDPILGRDLAFYLFTLPVLQALFAFLLGLLLFLGALTFAGYSATGAVTLGRGQITLSPLARAHLGGLTALLFAVVGMRFYLGPYELLAGGTSAVQDIFGYTDERARIPALRFLGFLSWIVAGVVAWGAHRRSLLPAGTGAILLAIASLVGLQLYPAVVQRFQVQPNELERETPYILAGIEHTRLGFGLTELRRDTLPIRLSEEPPLEQVLPALARLPIWTPVSLLTNFRQTEARFQYFDFHEVGFDRRMADGGLVPVAVAVREIDPAGIPDPNWQNLHLRERYLTGIGAVATPVHRLTADGRPLMSLSAIPPEFTGGEGIPASLALDRSQVHFGSRLQLYSVIVPSDEAFLAPGGERGTPGVDFPEGILMGSFLRKAAVAWRFQDLNLLFAREIDGESRLVFRRQVQERVRALAPFLLTPEPPYPILWEGRVLWILEVFTASRTFPLASQHGVAQERGVSYLRNSVKATVDAVTGETRLYVADPDDPILAAYGRGFPTLFTDMADAPPGLVEHFRYARTLFDAQSQVLLRFHQESPAVFHGQQDRWEPATERAIGTQPVPYVPEFILLTLPGEEEESFVLWAPFVPQGRQNLASLLAARWTTARGGELLLWDAPVAEQIPGPRQIEALIEQDPTISQQFSLWRQGGSEVWTGHLHLVPIGGTIFYMEPVFLAADRDAIPEIRRFVVSDGRRVVMDPTLSGAVALLLGGMTGREPPLTGESAGRGGQDMIPGVALRLLDEGEARLRAGDWEGFGRALDELRRVLSGPSQQGGVTAP